jgi:iron transport multicopper oxidase
MIIVVASLVMVGATTAHASGITNSGDDLRTGWYPENAALSPQLVSGGSFGQLWSANVEGQVYGQPLYDNGTVLIATEQNNFYGLDAATGARKWSTSLGTPWNPADLGCGDLTPAVGATATPVIDPASNVAYLTHKTYASGSSGPARWYMDALDMTSGHERPGFPVELAGSAQDAPARTFNPTVEMQRPGLLLMEGVVYAAFGSHCDAGNWQGWIFGVSTAGKLNARFVDNTTATGAGIWQSGAGLTSDGPGTILFSTGNGGAPTQPAAGSSPPANLGESVVRVDVQPDGSLKPVDFFAPFDAPSLDEFDADFASGGVTALPNEYFGTASLPHLAVAVGKEGYVYLLNRDSLGGFMQGAGGADKVVQRLGPNGGVWSRPGVWPGDGGWVYIPTASGSSSSVGSSGFLRAYHYGVSGTGQPTLSLAASSSDAFGFGSGAPVITSNRTESGSALVWLEWMPNGFGGGAQLRAYDPVPAEGKPVLRYSAPIGTATKFATPGVGGNRLYVGNREGKVLAFGSPVKAPLSGPATEFNTTTVGQSSQKTLTLTANEAVTVNSLSFAPSQFSLGPGAPALPVSLSAGQKLSIPIVFAPSQPGLLAGSVTVALAGGESPKFALSGTGQAEGALLSVTPRLVTFPGLAVGGEASESVTFWNGGASPLTITGSELGAGPFNASGVPAAGTKLGPGQSVTVTVDFEPREEGTFLRNFVLHSSAGSAAVGLSGRAASPATLTVSEEAISFGSVVLGSSATRSSTITNVGGTAATINKSKPPVGGEFAAASELPEGTTIQAGQSVTVSVTFAPTAPGPANGVWQINGDDTSGPHQIQFSGSGIAESAPRTPPSAPPSQGGVLGVVAVGPGLTGGELPGPTMELLAVLLRASPRGVVGVRLRCPSGQSRCAGTLALTARGGFTTAAGKAKARQPALARASFTLLGGHAGTVLLRLSPAGRSQLRRLRVLRLRLVIVARGSSGVSRTTRRDVTLRAGR